MAKEFDWRAEGQEAQIWAAASDHLLAWGGVARSRAGLTSSRDWKCAIELFRGFCETSGYLVAGDGAQDDIEADPVFVAVLEAVRAHSRGIAALANIVAEGGGTIVTLDPARGLKASPGKLRRGHSSQKSTQRPLGHPWNHGSGGGGGGDGGGGEAADPDEGDAAWSPSQAFYHGVPRSWTPVSPHPGASDHLGAPAHDSQLGLSPPPQTPSPTSGTATSYFVPPSAESLIASIQSAEWIDLPRGLISTSQHVTLPSTDRPLPRVPLPSGEPLIRSAFNKGLDVSLNASGQHQELSQNLSSQHGQASPIRKAKESHSGVGLRTTNRSSPSGSNISHIKKTALDALASQSDRSAFR